MVSLLQRAHAQESWIGWRGHRPNFYGGYIFFCLEESDSKSRHVRGGVGKRSGRRLCRRTVQERQRQSAAWVRNWARGGWGGRLRRGEMRARQTTKDCWALTSILRRPQWPRAKHTHSRQPTTQELPTRWKRAARGHQSRPPAEQDESRSVTDAASEEANIKKLERLVALRLIYSRYPHKPAASAPSAWSPSTCLLWGSHSRHRGRTVARQRRKQKTRMVDVGCFVHLRKNQPNLYEQQTCPCTRSYRPKCWLFFFEISTDTLPEFLWVMTFAGRVTQHSQWTHTDQMYWYGIVFFFWHCGWKPPFLDRSTSRIRKFSRTQHSTICRIVFNITQKLVIILEMLTEMPGICITFLGGISRSQWFRSMSGTGEAQWAKARGEGQVEGLRLFSFCQDAAAVDGEAIAQPTKWCKDSKKLVILCSKVSVLWVVELWSRKEPEAPFTSVEAVNTELLIQTRTHYVNQLSICGTVDDLSAIRLDRRKGTSQFLCGQADVDQVYLLVSSPTMALGNRMRGNVSSFDALISEIQLTQYFGKAYFQYRVTTWKKHKIRHDGDDGRWTVTLLCRAYTLSRSFLESQVLTARPEGTIIEPVLEVQKYKLSILDDMGWKSRFCQLLTHLKLWNPERARFANEIHDHKEDVRSSKQLLTAAGTSNSSQETGALNSIKETCAITPFDPIGDFFQEKQSFLDVNENVWRSRLIHFQGGIY